MNELAWGGARTYRGTTELLPSLLAAISKIGKTRNTALEVGADPVTFVRVGAGNLCETFRGERNFDKFLRVFKRSFNFF